MNRQKDRLICTIAVDMDHCTKYTQKPMQWYANRVDADFFILDQTDRDPPHLAKYDLLRMAREAEYKQVLYVDADVYIRRGVPDIFEYYTNALYNEAPKYKYYDATYCEKVKQIQEFIPTHDKGDHYFNTGVMIFDWRALRRLCKVIDECPEFITDEIYAEQHQFNLLLKRAGLPEQHLSQRWNSYAVTCEIDARFLLDSYFVHVPGMRTKENRERKLNNVVQNLP